MTSNVLDIYDHEVLAIERVLGELNAKARDKKLNYNDFEREIRDRFAAIGFEVDVNWYTFSVGGVEQEDAAMPEITVTGRAEKTDWDPDRQVHEAVNNILQLPGQDGWIKTSPEAVGRLMRGKGRGH